MSNSPNFLEGEIPPGVYGHGPHRRRVIQGIPCACRAEPYGLFKLESLIPGFEVIAKAPSLLSVRNQFVERLSAWLERSEQRQNGGNNQSYLKEDIARMSQYLAPQNAPH